MHIVVKKIFVNDNLIWKKNPIGIIKGENTDSINKRTSCLKCKQEVNKK